MQKKRTTKKASLEIPDLKSFSKEALEKLVFDLYSRFDIVRNFIDFRLTGDSEPMVKKYKKMIKKLLIEDIEDGTDGLNDAVRMIHEFSDFDPLPHDQSEIMLYFVETAVDCSQSFGDLYEEFYDETENMFEETLDFMKHHKILEEFRSRCKKILDQSADTGYGFHDSLGDSFYTYFPEGKPRKKLKVKKPVMRKRVRIDDSKRTRD